MAQSQMFSRQCRLTLPGGLAWHDTGLKFSGGVRKGFIKKKTSIIDFPAFPKKAKMVTKIHKPPPVQGNIRCKVK